MTDAEYQELLEMAYQQGTLAESEKEIILQIISLDQRMARDVMRPRAGMACISDDATVEEMIAAAKKFKHRRLPIYDETPDTIVGILNTRALLLDPKIDLADVIEFPVVRAGDDESAPAVQEPAKAAARPGHGAGRIRRHGGLGDDGGHPRRARRQNPHRAAQPEGFVMEKLAPDRWRVNGTMRLDDFRREFPALGDVDEVETMGGLLAHLLGVVPAAGESATFRGLKLTAQVADERRVRELLVQRLK